MLGKTKPTVEQVSYYRNTDVLTNIRSTLKHPRSRTLVEPVGPTSLPDSVKPDYLRLVMNSFRRLFESLF